jgi:two-component system, cell cycle sensor histidine kinase and response regulator CckA
VTESHRAEETLSESEQRYRSLVELAPDAILILDYDTIRYCNPACTALLGASSPQELLGRPSDFFFHPDEREAAALRRVAIRETGQPAPPREFCLLRLDNERVVVESYAAPCLYQGRPAIQVLMRDITKRKQTEASLNLLRSLIDQANDAIEVIDPETGRFLDVNEKACQSRGYTREEYLALTVPRIDPMVPRRPWKEICAEIRRAGARITEGQHRRKDGSVFAVEINCTYVRLDRDYLLAVVRDITERKRAEESLRLSEQRFRDIFENSLQGMIIHQGDLIRYANQAAATMFGYSTPDELEGRETWSTLVDPSEWAMLKTRIKAVYQGERIAPHPGWRAKRKDGSILWVTTTASLISWNNCPAIASIYIDITELKRADEEKRKLEAHIQHAQKLESLGVLAGGVAHDFNNLLTVINGNSHLLRTALEPDDPRQGLAVAIHAAGVQAAKLTRQMLAFSLGAPQQSDAVDINRMIAQSLETWRQVVGERIHVACDCSENLWPVVVDRSQMEQVLFNLILNARDAMPEGGQIRVTTSNHELPRPSDEAHLSHSGRARFVKISVEDTGTGMTENVQARIFEPFFTTKKVGQGTGLGLAMCHGIVRQSGGWIDVSSQPNHGSTFSILLPSSTNATPAPWSQTIP